jgi:hypothetical protein
MELEQTSNNIKNKEDDSTNNNNDDYDDNEHGYDENNDMTKCCPQYTFCIIIKLTK